MKYKRSIVINHSFRVISKESTDKMAGDNKAMKRTLNSLELLERMLQHTGLETKKATHYDILGKLSQWLLLLIKQLLRKH